MAFNSETAKQAGKKSSRKGKPNKTTGATRELIADFISEKWDEVTAEFDSLKPVEKFEVLSKLLPYITPKMQQNGISLTEVTPIDMSTWH